MSAILVLGPRWLDILLYGFESSVTEMVNMPALVVRSAVPVPVPTPWLYLFSLLRIGDGLTRKSLRATTTVFARCVNFSTSLPRV